MMMTIVMMMTIMMMINIMRMMTIIGEFEADGSRGKLDLEHLIIADVDDCDHNLMEL